jgi:hypothetical protein
MEAFKKVVEVALQQLELKNVIQPASSVTNGV